MIEPVSPLSVRPTARKRCIGSLTLAFVFYLATAQAADFIAFESGPVRPMALSPDGRMLFAVNTPDNRLEIHAVDESGALAHLSSVPVGMEPVAVAARDDSEVWVVNHLSDSVSIVNVEALHSADAAKGSAAFVARTLLVGDEPRDIVFAQGRAFIATAHRGQHRTHASLAAVPGAGDPQLHTPGIGRADVWVFDAGQPGGGVGGTPLKIVELFGDTPRALAVSPDGTTVYAAVFHSGNQTSVIHEAVMCRGFEDSPRGYAVGATWAFRRGDQPCVAGQMPRRYATASPNGPADKTLPKGRPLPSTSADGEHAPFTAMIVRWHRESGEWRDSRGLNYSNGIRFYLPDKDVFAIDANSLQEAASFRHVGTTLYNMATNPANGNIYVANTDAQNHIRFEGPGIRGESTVQGNIARVQVTVIDPGTGSVRKRHLNRHIDYSVLKAPAEVRKHSLSTPLELQVSADGARLYLAALGSDRIGVFATADLENDALWDGAGDEFDPAVASSSYLTVAGGPAGLLLDGGNERLYVYTHIDRGLKVVDAATGAALQVVYAHNPEPAPVVAGRRMLYDAAATSSNGESSCASCHVFGDTDHLSWNLGNPDAANTVNPQPFPTFSDFFLNCDIYGHYPGCEFVPYINGNGDQRAFSALKGPMATQTMRGMSTHGHMHWRGDRSTGYFGTDEGQFLDEKLSFKNFIVGFESLLGLDVALTSAEATDKPAGVIKLEEDVDAFADFMLAVQLPPNPIRSLDNTHSASARIGEAFFSGPRRSDGMGSGLDLPDNRNGTEPDGRNCEGCHSLDPDAGFYGTDGSAAHGGEVLALKVPHLRNLYQKVGMFGLPNREYFLPSTTDAHQGDQVRGFGFLHDGATDKLFNFLQGAVFDDGATTCTDLGVPGGSSYGGALGSRFGCDFSDGMDVGIPGDTVRQGLVDYLMEFDTDLAPIVGQQVTLDATNGADANPRIDLLTERAATPFDSFVLGGTVTECDLIVKGVVNGQPRGWVQLSDGSFMDDLGETSTEADVRALAAREGPLTYTCVPPGSGRRMGVDRDRDGVLDGLDNCPSVARDVQGDGDVGIGEDGCPTA